MNASMHWLSDRLGNCPDAADLEYGCVDWFRYEETDRSGARSRCRSRKREDTPPPAGTSRARLRDALNVQHEAERSLVIS